jgi:phosphatidylinositol-4,5-bisphosphate 3-kinase
MPELQTPGDVKYLQDQLALNLSDQEATTKFRQEIIMALSDTWRQIDNFFHNIKRKG